MKIGIIGGGIMGACLGYYLSKAGAQVEIFEAAPTLGGLAGSFTLADGTVVDRFYHTILSSDAHLQQLCAELEIDDRLRFHETRMGFFYRGAIHSMNNVVEFLRFPPLGWVDRFRLGFTVLCAQFIRDWRPLEGISVEQWLRRLGGTQVYQNIWLPMLKAKFDGSFEHVPATYIWARLVRMKSTRRGANQKEEAGHLIGGFMTLIQAMAGRIIQAGGKIHLGVPVSRIAIERNQALGICVGEQLHRFDRIIATLPAPLFQNLIPEAGRDYRDFLAQTHYLGIVCPLMVLEQPFTGYWTLNLTDEDAPFTGVIETTAYIDPRLLNGHHLVYLPKYTAPESALQSLSDEEIKQLWLNHLQRMFPQFERRQVREFYVQRARYVEPVHGLNETHLIPALQTPVDRLYLASIAQIYPALTNLESISRKAQEIAEQMMSAKPG